MGYNFLTEGNGLIACYDMYPTQFRSFADMINYLPILKENGFNAFWINPLQKPGEISDFFKTDKNNGVKIGNEVTASLYAVSDPFQFNPLFSQKSSDNSEKDLQLLTRTARDLGLVPMFDLVLNHVAIDSPLCLAKPHWFKGIHEDFKDVRGFNYKDEQIRKEIITEFWQPYVRRYMLDYGFDGVRVDAVGYVDAEVRREIYEYIQRLACDNGKPQPVIIDEALFNKRELVDEVNYLKLPGEGPTHITTEVYNVDFDLATSSLPPNVMQEEQLKASVVFQQKDGEMREQVKGGCINFSGNHNYRSLAMTVLFQMAKKRLQSDPLYYDFIASYQQTSEKSPELKEPLLTTLLYSYVSQIKKELENNQQETKEVFKTLIFKKLSLSALTGSGGWFLLSGDETCDITAKSVFQRKGAVDKSYYPQREHRVFSEHPEIIKDVLKKMAEENFLIENSKNTWMLNLYQELSTKPEMQRRLLVSHIENIKHQINAGIKEVQDRFALLLDNVGLSITFTDQDYLAKPRTQENGWLGLQDNFAFIRQINALLKNLPISRPGFSSALVTLPTKPALIIVVRKNGEPLDAPIDLAVVNLEQGKAATLTKEDIQSIAKNYCDQYFLKGTTNNNGVEWQELYLHILKSVAKNQIHMDESIKFSSIEGFEFKDTQINTFFAIGLEKKTPWKCNKPSDNCSFMQH